VKALNAPLVRRTLFWLCGAATIYFFGISFYDPADIQFYWAGLVFTKPMIGPLALLMWSVIFLKVEPNYARAGLIVSGIIIFVASIGTIRG
jgi:hypothetical protein